MQQKWDIEKFKQSDPNNFDSVGEQFIKELEINIKEICDLFNTQQFAKSLIYITDIICSCKKIYAIALDEAATNLKIFLDHQMEEFEGITQQKKSFQLDQQKEAAIKFITVMEVANETIDNWRQFKHLQKLELFEPEIKQITDTYIGIQNQGCNWCQLI